jgi:DNA repair protein RadC
MTIVVAHNHPSGNTEPSGEDNDLTSMLFNACMVMGICMLDHLIISKKGYYSFREQGVIKNLEELYANNLL